KSVALNVLRIRKAVPNSAEGHEKYKRDGTDKSAVNTSAVLSEQALLDSRRRLETAALALRIESAWGGTVWLVTNNQTRGHADKSGVVYTTRDAFFLVQLSEPDVRKLHAFRKRYGGSLEWKE